MSRLHKQASDENGYRAINHTRVHEASGTPKRARRRAAAACEGRATRSDQRRRTSSQPRCREEMTAQ